MTTENENIDSSAVNKITSEEQNLDTWDKEFNSLMMDPMINNWKGVNAYDYADMIFILGNGRCGDETEQQEYIIRVDEALKTFRLRSAVQKDDDFHTVSSKLRQTLERIRHYSGDSGDLQVVEDIKASLTALEKQIVSVLQKGDLLRKISQAIEALSKQHLMLIMENRGRSLKSYDPVNVGLQVYNHLSNETAGKKSGEAVDIHECQRRVTEMLTKLRTAAIDIDPKLEGLPVMAGICIKDSFITPVSVSVAHITSALNTIEEESRSPMTAVRRQMQAVLATRKNGSYKDLFVDLKVDMDTLSNKVEQLAAVDHIVKQVARISHIISLALLFSSTIKAAVDSLVLESAKPLSLLNPTIVAMKSRHAYYHSTVWVFLVSLFCRKVSVERIVEIINTCPNPYVYGVGKNVKGLKFTNETKRFFARQLDRSNPENAIRGINKVMKDSIVEYVTELDNFLQQFKVVGANGAVIGSLGGLASQITSLTESLKGR